MEEAAKGKRCWEEAIRRAQGYEAVGIHRLETDRRRGGRRAHHSRQKKAGKVVGHHSARAPGQGLEQPLARAVMLLHIGEVEGRMVCEPPVVLRHAVQHEAMDPIAGPPVAAAQRLEDHEGLAETPRPFHGTVQREVVRQAPVGDHPIEDVVAIAGDRCVVDGSDPQLRDALHRASHP